MKTTVRQILMVLILLTGGINLLYANDRPKLHELKAKKLEMLASGVAPQEKKGEWGYATSDGKYVISPVFASALPVNSRQVAFVAYVKKSGHKVWTPIDLKGFYLTDLEFDSVVKDFDDRGLAVVKTGGRYGVINHLGKMVANHSYSYFVDKGPVYVLYNKGAGCVAIAKDRTEKGYTTYSFAPDEHVIVHTETGYGILTPNKFEVTADFVYDSVKELSGCYAYVLQKGNKKYLYSQDKVSSAYDDVVPGNGNEYFAVKSNGKWGALTPSHFSLLSCEQEQVPVLKKDDFTAFEEKSGRYYVTTRERKSVSQYDDYLFARYQKVQSDYLLENTLELSAKKNVLSALRTLYATPEFAKVQHLDAAVQFSENLKLVLLSHDNAPAQYLDIETGWMKKVDDVLYHAFPSKTGAPAFASCLRDGKFGIIDIRNKNVLVPFEYDKIQSLRNGYAVLLKPNFECLYNVQESQMIATGESSSVNLDFINLGLAILKHSSGDAVYSMTENKYLVQADGDIYYVDSLSVGSEMIDVIAVSNGEKYALYALTSGERLTDFLFDSFDVGGSFFGGKYLPVCVADKWGVYDLSTRKYILPCAYDSVREGDVYEGNHYVYVDKGEKIGLYNLGKKKFLFETQFDKMEISKGLVLLTRDERNAIFYLKRNVMIDYVRLDDEEGEIIRFPTTLPLELDLIREGYFWLYESSESTYECPFYCDLNSGKIACCGEGESSGSHVIGNYYYFDSGDASPGIIQNTKGCGYMGFGHSWPGPKDFILKSKYPLLKYDYVIDNCVDESFRYEEGYQGDDNGPANNAALYKIYDLNIVHGVSDVIGCEVDSAHVYSSMEYVGRGVVKAKMLNPENTWIYDIVSDQWLIKTDKYVQVWDSDGLRFKVEGDATEYLLHEDLRVLVPVNTGFDLKDYEDLQLVNSSNSYSTSYNNGKRVWKLYDRNSNKSYPECDRISLMYQQK